MRILLAFMAMGIGALAFGLRGEGRRISTDTARTSAPSEEPAGFHFVENRGQWRTEARYVARLPGLIVGVGPGRIDLQVPDEKDASRGVLLRAVLEDAAVDRVVTGEEAQAVRHSFFLGNDPSRWHRGLPGHGRVRMRGVCAGVDLVLSVEQGVLAYEWQTVSDADLGQVRVRWEGLDGSSREEEGLSLALGGRTLVRPVGSGPHVQAASATPYWATYLGSPYSGGQNEQVTALAIDPAGNLVAAGDCGWIGFPTLPGSYVNVPQEELSVFVVRFDPRRGILLASSILGGSHQQERLTGLAIDRQGNAVIGGHTFSTDFPTTPGSFQPVKNVINSSSYVAKLTPDGSTLIFSTFLEGTTNGSDARALAISSTGAPIVAGRAHGPDFPITPNAFDPLYQSTEGFLTRFDPTGSYLEWSTFLGGIQSDWVAAIAVDALDQVTCTGVTTSDDFPTTPGAFQPTAPTPGISTSREGFVTRLTADGSALVWSTFLGGRADDQPRALAIDPSGGVLVGGTTLSVDFPVTYNAFQTRLNKFQPHNYFHDGFLTRLSADGSTLVYSTFFGDTYIDEITGVAIDASGVITFGGWGGEVPVTPGALQMGFGAGDGWFASRLDPTGQRLLYSTYLGGLGSERSKALATSADGRIHIGGFVYFGGFPTTPGSVSPTYNGGQTDAVLASFEPFLEGVVPHGDSTPSCGRALRANATIRPTAGEASFSLYCSQAPPDADGWLVLSGAPGSGAPGPGGTTLWVDNAGQRRFPVRSDAAGWIEMPLEWALTSPGISFAAQFLFPDPCGAPSAWCASNGLIVTAQ